MDFHEALSHVLTQEGAQIALEGSHEARVWNALPVKGEGTPLTAQQLQQAVGKESASVGQGRAFKAKWIGKEGDGFVKLVGFNTSRLDREFTGIRFLDRSLRLKIRRSWNFGKSIPPVLFRRGRKHWPI